MTYSLEEVYKYSGQFDKVVTVSFRFGSDARNKYGDYITGKFYYTPKERANLEDVIAVEELPKTNGLIKFEVGNGINELSEKQIGDLRFEGVLASDISEILQFSQPVENEFSKSDIRNLPDLLTINSNLSDVDEVQKTAILSHPQRIKVSIARRMKLSH